jgi:hypothetical protein
MGCKSARWSRRILKGTRFHNVSLRVIRANRNSLLTGGDRHLKWFGDRPLYVQMKVLYIKRIS